MKGRIYDLVRGAGPFIATAIHNGHIIRKELLDKMCIQDSSSFTPSI